MALMKLNRAVLLMTVILMSPPRVSAGSLREVWKLDLSKLVKGSPAKNSASLPLQLLKFSPDGRQLAVAVAWDTSAAVFKSQLLVIDLENPGSITRQFEITGGIGNEDIPGPTLFEWSPDGKDIFLAGKLIHLQNGASCQLPRPTAPPYWPGSLVGNGRLIQGGPELPDGNAVKAQMESRIEWARAHPDLPYPLSVVPPNPPEPKSHFRFFDSECQQQGQEWQLMEAWNIHDVSTERGVIAVTRNIGFLKDELLIVDPIARKVVRRWPPISGVRGWFADGGKVICDGDDVEDMDSHPVTCWDVDSGKKIGETSTINGGLPLATASHSSRIVASDYHGVISILSDLYAASLKRRVVWDFRTGKEMASWRPGYQSYINIKNEREDEPFKFALSPDGEYVAEGGNGFVRLYKVIE